MFSADDAGQKLAGRLISNSGYDPTLDRPKGDEFENVCDGSIFVNQVQILDNGWVRAVANLYSAEHSFERVDLLLPPQEVRAIYTRSVINSGFQADTGEGKRYRRLKLGFDGRQEEGATG